MTIIKASEVQHGDKIAVAVPGRYTDREHTTTYTGVAHHSEHGRWYTEADWSLFTHERNAVIELLDRPKPKLTVPTLPNAVVKYTLKIWGPEPRTAVRDASATWRCYDDAGNMQTMRNSDEDFQKMLLEDSPEFEVVFAGVAK